MYDSVPFDPPYVIKIHNQEGERWIKVLEDGSEVPCEAPLDWPVHSREPARPSPPASTNPKRPQVTMLNVPYAEKDEAKRLGARWDPARKKWYVPQGVDAAPFSRWVKSE